MPQDALPSLRVTQSHVAIGKPNPGRHSIAAVRHGEDSSIAFAIASNEHVDLVDADLHLRSTLVFSDAFPNTAQYDGRIQAIAIDNTTQRIAAALEDHVAVWHKTSEETYKIHSTASPGFTIQCLDLVGDTLVVGGPSIAVYGLDHASGLPLWARRCTQESTAVVELRLSPCGQYIASRPQRANAAGIFLIPKGEARGRLEQVCSPWHPDQVRNMEWLRSDVAGGVAAFSTETEDGTVRIWKCFPDEPHYFVLWLTIKMRDRTSFPVANLWLATAENARLVSILDDGSILLHEVQDLTSRSSLAGRYSTTRYSQARLTRQHLSILKYPSISNSQARLSILGLSRSSALGLLRLNGPSDPASATLQPWKYARIRHRENICMLAAAEDPSFAMTIGQSGEAILWRARKLHDRTALMHSIASYRPSRKLTPLKAAISADGKTAVIVTTDVAVVLVLRDRKLVQTDLALPHFPIAADILSLNFDNSNAGVLFLAAVDSTSAIFVWRIEEDYAELVCQSALPVPAVRVVVTPQSVSSAARVAFTDREDRVHLGSLLLEQNKASYRTTGNFITQLSNIDLLACSTTNFIACVGSAAGSLQLRIINTQSSLFTTGLEYTMPLQLEDPPQTIAFSNTPDGLPLLLVTFQTRFVIIAERRLDYYQENTSMAFGGSVIATLSNQLHLFSRDYAPSSPSDTDILTRVHEANSALPDYHPQLLVQCLLSGKNRLVNKVLRRLYQCCRAWEDRGDPCRYVNVSLEEYMSGKHSVSSAPTNARTNDVFARSFAPSEDSGILTEEEAKELLTCLEKEGALRLTRSEKAHLAVVIETHIQVDSQRRALDNNGTRFLLSLKSFTISHRSRSPPPTRPPSPGGTATGSQADSVSTLPQMRWRDVLWAFHSESQEILLSACDEVCGKPMCWNDAKQFCLPLWIKSSDSLVVRLESIARNEFTRDDSRDPTTCSLYYFALRKKRLVQGLWRQATFHKERGVMMKFLMNDFEDPRWRSASIKNAYALMSKHRFHYAAAFFLLGDSLKDCLSVCLRQLDDWQLAVMLARVYEGDDGPQLRNLLNDHIIPMAFARGYRRLASWAFWMMKRRDLAVRVIVTPFAELLSSLNNPNVKEIGTPGQEDPSLVLLYGELRDWSMQTIRGSWEIIPIRETQFVTHIAEAYCRMGCHALALDLVCKWQFTSAKLQLLALANHATPSAGALNRDATSLNMVRPGQHHRRRSSLFQPKRRSTIIMDLPSTLPSRSASPAPDASPGPQVLDAAHREGLKKVMKEVKAPPPEFDMSSFGF